MQYTTGAALIRGLSHGRFTACAFRDELFLPRPPSQLLYFDHHGPGYRSWGTIGGQIRYVDDVLFHLHLHDNTGEIDHVEIGTGKVDWDDALKALADIGYQGSMILEPNPTRVTPEGIRRSADFLRKRARELDLLVDSQ